MEQLILELAKPEAPGFANFVAGRNHEVVAMLRRLAIGDVGETSVVIWGPSGVGKTHLLHAVAAAAIAAGRPVRHVDNAARVELPAVTGALVCVDTVDAADAD